MLLNAKIHSNTPAYILLVYPYCVFYLPLILVLDKNKTKGHLYKTISFVMEWPTFPSFCPAV